MSLAIVTFDAGATSTSEVVNMVLDGKTLSQPSNCDIHTSNTNKLTERCPDAVWKVAKSCWAMYIQYISLILILTYCRNPSDRPNFRQIFDKLCAISEDKGSKESSEDSNPEYQISPQTL